MTELILMWVKNNWKQLVILAAFVAVYATGHHNGYVSEHTKFQEHLNKDTIAAAVAKADFERKVKEQEDVTNTVAKEYADAVNKINEYYRTHPNIIRLCPGTATAIPLPSQSQNASGADQASHGITEAPSAIEIDIHKAALEVLQCQKLIEWEQKQEQVK